VSAGVLFDAMETLLTPVPPLRVLLAEGWLGPGGGTSPESVSMALEAMSREGRWPGPEADPGPRLAAWTSFCGEALARSGGAGDGPLAAVAARHVLEPGSYRPFGDALPCLRRLRGLGFRVGLVSNFDLWLHDLLDALGLRDLLDGIVVSGELGIVKPAPGIFDAGARSLGLAPGRCLHVGDSIRIDVEGARRAGLTPVLLDRRDRHPQHAGHRITGLDQLDDLALRWREGS
jgi:putative hydrolase of the HAD superfamily